MEAKKSILLLCFAVFQLAISAQNKACNYTLNGKVSDEHDSSPLSFSYIVNPETHQVVTADQNGNYVINNLCKGWNHFIISHIGCESDTVAIQINQLKQLQNFQLEHHAKELATVWIEENKKSLHTISGTEMKNNKEGGLIAEMMEKIPGVHTINTGSNFSIPVVHGMSGNRLSIINNEIPLLYQQWGSEHSPEIDPFTITEISLVSGTEALRYSAGNIGGALLASSSEKRIDTGIHGKIHTSFGSNKRMGSLAAMLTGRMDFLPNLSWRIHANGKKAGNTRTPDYYLNNTGMEQMNYSADFRYEFQSSELEIGHSSFSNKIGIFPGSHVSDLTELQHLMEKEKPDEEFTKGFSYKINEPFQETEHQTTFLKYDLNVNKRNKLNLSFSRQNNKRNEYESHEDHTHEEHGGHEVTESSLEDVSTTSYHLVSYIGSANWRITSIKNHWTEFGIQAIIANNEVGGENKFIPAYNSKIYSTYGLRKWYMNKFTLDAGFRFEHSVMEIAAIDRPLMEDRDQSFNSFSFSSGIEFNLNKTQDIKLNLSLAQRAPNIDELYSKGIHHGTASIENGNSNLNNESNHEISVNYRLRKEKLWFNVYVYNKYIKDFIYLDIQGTDSTEHGIYPEYSWKQTHANYIGADLFIRYWLFKHLNMDLEASYLDAKNLNNSSPLSFIPANSVKSTFQYSFDDTEKLQNQYFQISVKHVAKQNKVPENLIFNSPAAYTLLNAGLGASIKLADNKLSITFEINNILDKKYRDYLDRFRYFSDSMGRDFSLHLSYGF